MGNVRMRAEQINYGASNVKAALDDLDPMDLIALNNRMNKIDAWKDTVKVEEKTGAEVTFTNALALNAVSLSAEIEPIQDLHGYDHPWAGGAGKNKFNPNFTGVTGITPSVDSNGYLILTVSGAVSATFLKGQSITLKANTAYTLSCAGASSNAKVSLRNSDGSTIYASVEVDGGSSVYTPTEDITVYFYIRVETSAALTATLKPQLEEGATATAFVRWANICPISGRTAVGIADEGGDNLFTIDESKIGKDYGGGNSAPRWWQTISLPVGTYIFRYGGTISGTYSQLCFGVADSPLPFSDINAHARFTSLRDDTIKYVSITITNEYPYAFVGAIKSSGTITKADIESLQITLRDTITVTIQLGTTVYGVVVNATTGVMTITDVKTLIDDINKLGSINVSASGNWAGYTLTGLRNYDSQICAICDKAKGISFNQRTASENVGLDRIYANDTANTLILRLSNTNSITDKTDFFNYWEDAEVCYKLATPTTIQLTPTQLEMLKGYNRLSSDGGGDITVEAYTGAAWGGDEA